MFAVTAINGRAVPRDEQVHVNIHHNVRAGGQPLDAYIDDLFREVGHQLPQGGVPMQREAPVQPARPQPVRAEPEQLGIPEGWLAQDAQYEALMQQQRDNPQPARAQHRLALPTDILTGGQLGRWLLPEADAGYQAAFGRSFVRHCHRAGIRADQSLRVLRDLHQVHTLPRARHKDFSDAERARALTAIIDTAGMGFLRDAAEIIAESRSLSWTRLATFSGVLAVTGLHDGVWAGTLGYATYQAGAQAGRSFVGMKAAGLTAHGLALGVGAAAAGTASGVGAAVTGLQFARSVQRTYQTVQAFRDVWDNTFSRDAFLMHRIRDHVLAEGEDGDIDEGCRHGEEPWTAPMSRQHNRRNGYRGYPRTTQVAPG